MVYGIDRLTYLLYLITMVISQLFSGGAPPCMFFFDPRHSMRAVEALFRTCASESQRLDLTINAMGGNGYNMILVGGLEHDITHIYIYNMI